MPDLISILGAGSSVPTGEGQLRLTDTASPLVGNDFSNVFQSLAGGDFGKMIARPALMEGEKSEDVPDGDPESDQVVEAKTATPEDGSDVLPDTKDVDLTESEATQPLDRTLLGADEVAPMPQTAPKGAESDIVADVDTARAASIVPNMAVSEPDDQAPAVQEVATDKAKPRVVAVHPVEFAVRSAMALPSEPNVMRTQPAPIQMAPVDMRTPVTPTHVPVSEPHELTKAVPATGATADPILKVPSVDTPAKTAVPQMTVTAGQQAAPQTASYSMAQTPPVQAPGPQPATAEAQVTPSTQAVSTQTPAVQYAQASVTQPQTPATVQVTAAPQGQKPSEVTSAPMAKSMDPVPAQPVPATHQSPAAAATPSATAEAKTAAEAAPMVAPQPVEKPKSNTRVTESNSAAVPQAAPEPTAPASQPVQPSTSTAAQQSNAQPVVQEIAGTSGGGEMRADGGVSLSAEPTSRSSEPATQTFTAPTRAPEVAREIARQIAPSIVATADGAVDIALSPKELGHVRMSLSLSESGVTLIVSGERPETIDLMRRHAEELSATFKEMGYENISFSFSTDGNAGTSQGQSDEGGSGSSATMAGDDPLLTSVSAQNDATPQPSVSDGGLDLRM